MRLRSTALLVPLLALAAFGCGPTHETDASADTASDATDARATDAADASDARDAADTVDAPDVPIIDVRQDIVDVPVAMDVVDVPTVDTVEAAVDTGPPVDAGPGTCADPIALDLSSGHATVMDTTTGRRPDPAAGCVYSSAGNLVYAFTLTTPKIVSATVTTTGIWTALLALRAPDCTGGYLTDCLAHPSFTQSLPAGDYILVVSGFSSTDHGGFTLDVTASDPSPGDTCADPITLDLSTGHASTTGDTTTRPHDPAINSCLSAGADTAIYSFTLTTGKLVAATLTTTGTPWDAGLLLRGAACATPDLLCPAGGTMPSVRRFLGPGTYTLVVGGAAATEHGTYSLDVTATDPPPGDTCGNVVVIPSGSTTYTDSGNTALAAPDFAAGACTAAASPDVVYEIDLTMPQLVDVTLTTGTTWNAAVELRSGSTCPGSASQQCDATAPYHLSRGLPAGRYFIVVKGTGTAPDGGAYTLNVNVSAIPPGDSCANPIVIPAGAATYSDSGDTTMNGADLGAGACSATLTPDVVYQLVLTSTQQVDATLTASWNATLELRTGTVCPGGSSTVCVATSPFHINHILPAGTYYLVVKGRTTTPNAGPYTLAVTQTPSSLPGYATSTAPAGVHWIDACAAAGSTTLLSNVDDGISAGQTLPFTFQFYASPYTTIFPSADGYVVFGIGTNATNYGTYMLPATSAPRPAMFIYGHDLFQRATGVCIATVGTAPNRQTVIETNNAYHFGDMSTMLTFEAILSEGTNTIDFVYNSLSGPGTSGGSAVVGVQNEDGTLATTFEYSQVGSLMNGLVVRFTPTH